MKKAFKDIAKDQLESVSLNQKQLDELMNMQYAHANIPPIKRIAKKQWYQMAGLALVMLFSIIMILQYSKSYSQSILIQKIANEVAESHLKMKPMEVETTEINALQQYFTKLDFYPGNSQRFDNNPRVALAGGRYCSIQGSTAAQLRYMNKQGGYVTLFETSYDVSLYKQLPDIDKGGKPIVTYAKGIKVTIWLEKGLLMVSTENS